MVVAVVLTAFIWVTIVVVVGVCCVVKVVVVVVMMVVVVVVVVVVLVVGVTGNERTHTQWFRGQVVLILGLFKCSFFPSQILFYRVYVTTTTY